MACSQAQAAKRLLNPPGAPRRPAGVREGREGEDAADPEPTRHNHLRRRRDRRWQPESRTHGLERCELLLKGRECELPFNELLLKRGELGPLQIEFEFFGALYSRKLHRASLHCRIRVSRAHLARPSGPPVAG